jgi:fatty acid desaturase
VQISRIEWPTIGLAVFIYGGWALLTFFHAQLPTALAALLGAWLIAWHSSLQHELLHGHPTSCSHLNHAIGFIPLSLWLPYNVYRSSHLAHHRAETLTDPLNDLESYYWTPQSWTDIGPLGRHLVAVLTWIVGVCGMSPCFYLFGIVYPGTSLSLIRSFGEHRAARGAAERIAIVENARILGPLFLFNNLHVVHHERPDLPWYRISGWYRKHREALIAANGGRVYDGYFDVARQFLFKPHDVPVHPFIS